MKRQSLAGLVKHFVIVLLIFLTFYPFLYMLMTSLKTIPQFYHSFWLPTWPPEFGNYVVAWGELYRYVVNSLIITVFGSLITVLLCSMSAFAFARVEFRFKSALYFLIVGTMMIPPILVLIPLFMWIKDLRLLNTRLGLILSYIAMGQPFGIFILRSFFEETPKEIFEAARIDGASFQQQYRFLGMPLSLNIVGSVIIINVLYIWNDYIWPMVVISSRELKPISTGLMVYFGQYNVQYGFLMAGCIIASLPLIILFFFTMKYFIAGLMSGAVKA